MELYTSLTRLKMSMNNGRMPPMTPLTEKARRYLDPDFTPGMGALEESQEYGLRCPVRGCGRFAHMLGTHLTLSHGDLGGRLGVLRLLGIPSTAGAMSTRARMRLSDLKKEAWRAGKYTREKTLPRFSHDPETVRRRSKTLGESSRSVNKLNLMNQCESQLAHKMIDLQHRLGREPTYSDVEREYGKSLVHAAVKVFGSWGNLRAHVGMRVRRKGLTADEVYDSLKAYWDEHKCLPTIETAYNPKRTPPIPGPKVIMAALGVCSWKIAMQQAAFVLGLEDKRYGVTGRYLRGGQLKGESCPTSKLKESQVREVLATCRTGGRTARSFASEFGVSESCINMIVEGRTWRHLQTEVASVGMTDECHV